MNINAIQQETSQRKVALTPLADEARTTLPTDEAAGHLNRHPQTLRLWACKRRGPLRPLTINGRLAWRVADLRKLLEANP